LKPLNDLAEGLGIVIKVFYQRRRTELGDQIVDHLSKGESRQVESLWPEGVRWTGRPSNELKGEPGLKIINFLWVFS
jgi:hypothetical protein